MVNIIELRFDELPEELKSFIPIYIRNSNVDTCRGYWYTLLPTRKIQLWYAIEESDLGLLSGIRKDLIYEAFVNVFRKYRLGMWNG